VGRRHRAALAELGFAALATTSPARHTLGAGRSAPTRSSTNLPHDRRGDHLPTNGDLENCGPMSRGSGGDDPPCQRAGLAGGSIEDFTGDRSNPIYGFTSPSSASTPRSEMAKRLPIPFVLTARRRT